MFSFKIAARFLSASKGQTALITIGIAIGVSVQVFIGSLIQGLQNDLIDTTIGSSSHITVTDSARGERMDDTPSVFDELNQIGDDIQVVSKVLEGPANITNDDSSEPAIIRGFLFEDANKIYNFDDRLIEGNLPSLESEIIIGKARADNFSLTLGDELSLFLPDQLESVDLEIVGLFDFGTAQVNETWVVTHLDTAKAVFDTEGISAYEMQVDDIFSTDQLALEIEEVVGNDYRVSEWQGQNEELLSGLNGQSVSSLMIQVFVLISVVLGIASVLAITVMQKSKQLGIIKAMGATDKQASLIFLFQGMLLGIIGAVIGVLLGLLLGFSFTIFAVDSSGEPVVGLFISPSFIAISALIAIGASIIASFIPARRSAKLSVIEVIRNG